MIGGLDKFPWSHFYDVLADHYGNPQQLINWFRGKQGSTIVTPGMMKAGQVLQTWVKDGYFESGANGVSDSDAVARFDHGQSLYKLDGPWATSGEPTGSWQEPRLLPHAAAEGGYVSRFDRLAWLVGRRDKQEQKP